ncbi:hypothetical protein TNCV_3817991 [Trichonephila clavipes]|nr:hypothetical protein TNCV_3817991 [Trichonephila clavipes]
MKIMIECWVAYIATLRRALQYTCNGCLNSNCPSARRPEMIRTEASSKGVAYVWMTDNETVGVMRAARAM